MPKLIVTDGTGAVTEHEMGVGPVTVGRSTDCNVVVLEAQVSRQHAVIEYDGERLHVRDGGSHNGTWVNGKRVPSGPEGEIDLTDGDEIRIGETVLKVVLDEASGASFGEPGRAASAAPRRPDLQVSRPTGEPVLEREESETQQPTREVEDEEEILQEGQAEPEAVEKDDVSEGLLKAKKGASPKAEKAEQEKAPAKKRSSRRRPARETVERPAPSGPRRGPDQAAPQASQTKRTVRRKRVVLGGMRLSEQQQTMVKIASFAVMVLCIIAGAWLVVQKTKQPRGGGTGRIIRTDPRANPDRLCEEACNLAREAREAEDRRDLREALRLICEAKDKVEEADRLYTEIAHKHEGEGFGYIQKGARRIKVRAKVIREQHFQIDMRLRRQEGRL